MFSSSECAVEKVSEAILITGTARSGTTILSKLIHSFYQVECAFEPPQLYSLFNLHNRFNKVEDWKLLYETYLYEDFYLNAISGRSINCNARDDSSIYKVKTLEDIENRLGQNKGKLELEGGKPSGRVAYKMPDVLFMVDRLDELYPQMQFVVIEREPISTINSLIKKKWFSDDSLAENSYIPFCYFNKYKIPFFVEVGDYEKWVKYNEVERCSYYYLNIMKRKLPSKVIKLSYEELLKKPHDEASKLANELGLKFGEKTEEVINEIKFQEKERDLNILRKIEDKELYDQIKKYSC